MNFEENCKEISNIQDKLNEMKKETYEIIYERMFKIANINQRARRPRTGNSNYMWEKLVEIGVTGIRHNHYPIDELNIEYSNKEIAIIIVTYDDIEQTFFCTFPIDEKEFNIFMSKIEQDAITREAKLETERLIFESEEKAELERLKRKYDVDNPTKR